METEENKKTKFHAHHAFNALDALYTLIFYLSILIFIIGFGFRDTPTPFGWYQQFMPYLNNRPISDLTFLDSLTGYAVTPYVANDTAFIIKTTNSGDNWNILFRQPTNTVGGFNRVQFLSANTGFACGNFLWKTTNAGINWFNVNTSGIFPMNMYVLNNDTIWLVDSDGLAGGVFLTTNGGLNWTHQINWGSTNPSKIYMFNASIGFIGGGYTAKTTDGGSTWNLINGQDGFDDIYFADSLTGWKCSAFGMKKTTDGGYNWITQILPSGGIIHSNNIGSFSNINRDTIWGNGGYVLYPNNQIRQFLNRTTDGGNSWLIQIPDTTAIPFIAFGGHINFINKLIGWGTGSGEIHTVTGGDTVFLTGLQQISKDIPKEFILFQNYPNPFNPNTNIKYQIAKNVRSETSNVKLSIFDITGKRMVDLVNEKHTPGEFTVTFDGTGYSSGVYFYSLYVNGVLVETKRMILLK